MLFQTLMRREMARLGLASFARAIAVDTGPTRRRRTPKQHFSNGIGAILHATSEIAYRPHLVVSLCHAARPKVRSEVRYGLAELRRSRAHHQSEQPGLRQRTLLAASLGAGATVALLIHGKRVASLDPEDSL